MENGTDGTVVTFDTARGATHGSGGSWSTVPETGLTQLFVSATDAPLPSPASVAGTTYTDAGSTRSFKMHNTVDHHYIKYTFGTPQSKVSIGMAMMLSPAGVHWGTT